ncbi:hypothetical protein [Mycobacterium simiae]|uniref:hypothetical protein n=1 Tax=Mycobacterium simiae TaxID=1784 RepID=UPI0021CDD700|nr:hypothetical protein [Mycobacterium simiae]
MSDVTVDSPLLEAAGEKLRSLELPQAPKPTLAFGTDLASVANDEVLPHIYLAASDALSAAQASVQQIGANIVTAANTYADTDKTLGGQLSQHQFQPAEPAGSTPAEDRPPSERDHAP